ncbi:regulatory protein, luxR family [Haloechinothrix alba]|uniref:Regulatory protein, luxR family n=1 Tax=Haloechinothrix alba TaxID=664784 RepID=A0A238W418_9PSEU|nr:helix-turn-helix transcriptional regulator [Haloechinothrix alba]SNR41266.1 regulatory protein, luxR family [Haloechinothrix alba]
MDGTELGETLGAARDAYRRRDWRTAAECFRSAADEHSLSTDDLYALSQCAWWLGEMSDCAALLERVHRAYLDEGDQAAAAMAALELGVDHLLRGDEPVGSGWLGRAARLAETVPEGPVHGYLRYILEVEAQLGAAELDGAVDAARRVRDLGRAHGETTLVACGLNGEGRALIRSGEAGRGLALLDEAMTAVLAGEVDDAWAGNLYCNTIAACHELGDFRRMARWTELTERWLETLPAAALFAGICRVHRAQLAALAGDWVRAEREATRVCEELAGISVANVAEAWYAIGEVRRRRADLDGAEQAFSAAHAHGRDPQPGLALLRLGQGRIEAAHAAIRTAIAAAGGEPYPLATLHAARVEIAVAAGDTATARAACAALEEAGASGTGQAPGAMAAAARGTVELAEGRAERALPYLRQACRAWRELDAPYEAARTCVSLSRAYRAMGDAEAAGREAQAAATLFARLGIDAATGLGEAGGGGAGSYGLSDRELEVLGLVAEGRSNPEIAEALFISRKTVARHLSNIFTKLGVGSRTAAARYAFERDLSADLTE